MESNKCPEPTNSNREQASSAEEVSTREEVLSQEGRGLNHQLVSYHISSPDGAYVPVILSPGYRFFPEDDELILYYLNKEINKEYAKYITMIPHVNVYKHAPDELAEKYQSLAKDQWYFFTSRHRKYLRGGRPNRAAGDGYWKATGPPAKVPLNGGRVASKRTLVFYRGKAPNGTKTHWVMHEYVSDLARRRRSPGQEDMLLDDCVLCRIHKKSNYSPKKKKDAAAAASSSGETEKSAARKSKKQAPTLQEQQQYDNEQAMLHNPAEQLISRPDNIQAEANQLDFNNNPGYSLENFGVFNEYSSAFGSLSYNDTHGFQNGFGDNNFFSITNIEYRLEPNTPPPTPPLRSNHHPQTGPEPPPSLHNNHHPQIGTLIYEER